MKHATKFIAVVLAALTAVSTSVFAQDDLINRVRALKPFVATRASVEKDFGVGESNSWNAWYYFPNTSVQFVFSDGTCTNEWLAPKDVLVEASVNFFDDRPLAVLEKRVAFRRFRYSKAFDVPGEREYFDSKAGVSYGVNIKDRTWGSITFFATSKFHARKCDD